MKKIIFLSLFSFVISSHAYIPSVKMILQRVCEKNNADPVYFEQEVTIQAKSQKITLKEMWLVENSSKMKVIIQGQKELKDKIQWIFNYTPAFRESYFDKQKKVNEISVQFVEPIFFIKDSVALTQKLVNFALLPAGSENSSPFLKGTKEYTYVGEPFVRLGRSGGHVAYVLGPKPQQVKARGLWVEQDYFNISKMKVTEDCEMSVESYGVFDKSFRLPKQRSYSCPNWQVQVAITDVRKANDQLQKMFNSAQGFTADAGIDLSPLKESIYNFYATFR